VKQVLCLLDNSILASAPVHNHDAILNIPAAAAAGDSGNGVLHPVCAVDGGPHCHFDRAVGTEWECEWELQSLCDECFNFGTEYRYVGVFGTA
jgi:hypothetical protein